MVSEDEEAELRLTAALDMRDRLTQQYRDRPTLVDLPALNFGHYLSAYKVYMIMQEGSVPLWLGNKEFYNNNICKYNIFAYLTREGNII